MVLSCSVNGSAPPRKKKGKKSGVCEATWRVDCWELWHILYLHMPPVTTCDMGTTRAVSNHGPNHWSAQRVGGSWILGIPSVTEDCENQTTRAEIFLGLKGQNKTMCVCVGVHAEFISVRTHIYIRWVFVGQFLCIVLRLEFVWTFPQAFSWLLACVCVCLFAHSLACAHACVYVSMSLTCSLTVAPVKLSLLAQHILRFTWGRFAEYPLENTQNY